MKNESPSKTIKEQLDDIPGTYVFTKERCRQGLHLNLFLTSLGKPENRAEFLADEAKFLAKFPMTEEQRRVVRARDWIGMLKLGGNIYHMSKLGGTDRKNNQQLASLMSGMPLEDYRSMMVAGGRPLAGNRSKTETAQEK